MKKKLEQISKTDRKKQGVSGLFFTFEGIDGTGKSFQLGRTAEYLEHLGYRVVKTKEPGGTVLGQRVRELLFTPGESDVQTPRWCKESELFLFLADRCQHVCEVIAPALAEGKIVLCDRYLDSTIAYQAAGYGLNIAAILEFLAQLPLPIPQKTLLLTLPTEARYSKENTASHNRLDGESTQFFSRVQAEYLKLHQQYPERIARIEANRAIEEVSADIIAALTPALSKTPV